jgi:hypothetical protein
LSDVSRELAAALRERRTAERNEIVAHLKSYVQSVSEMETEIKHTKKMCDDLMFNYVVDRLSKNDREGLTIFKNMLPQVLKEEFDRIVGMYETMYGAPPKY